MSKSTLRESEIKYIIQRAISNADLALEDASNNQEDEFYKGRMFAYYEMLDTIKNELIAREQDLKEFGLDIDLEKMFLK